MSRSTENSTLGGAVLTALIIGSFVVLVSVALPEGNSTYAAVQNFGHFVLFACLGWAALPIVHDLIQRHFVTSIAVTGVGLMLLGLIVELVQTGMANRSASISDFLLDVVGIVAGFLVVLRFQYLAWSVKPVSKSLSLIFIGLLGFLTAFALKPLVPLVGYDLLRPGLPVVRSFDHLFAEQKIETVGRATYQKVSDHPQYGCCALRVAFSRARYSGVLFEENKGFFRGDWSDYAVLNIKVFSSLPNTRQIALRINDRLHNNLYEDRYNSVLSILPGLNELAVPIAEIARMGRKEISGRTMDIDDITRIQMFASEVENPFTLDLLSIELE